MNSKNFDKLITDSLNKFSYNYIDESEFDYTPHEFSPEIDQKIQNIPIQYEKSGRNDVKHSYINCKKLISIAASLVITSISLSYILFRGNDGLYEGSADYKPYRPIIAKEKRNKYTVYVASKDLSAPDKIYDRYEITVGLEDFDLIEYDTSMNNYMSYHYKNDEYRLHFSQSTKRAFNVHLNTQHSKKMFFYLGDSPVIYHDMVFDVEYLAWEKDKYIFSLMVCYDGDGENLIGREELVIMAESLEWLESLEWSE